MVGTVDTKGEELRYVRDLIAQAGIAAVLVDVGPRNHDLECDVRSKEVASHHPEGPAAVQIDDRGRAIEAMTQAFTRFLSHQRDVGGVIGLGGSGGSAIIAPALQALPIGVPKILVSTLASGDVSAYVGTSDIHMINPVTDLAGLNRASRAVLANAAHALVGMLKGRIEVTAAIKPGIGLTMYGVTTPCVRQVTDRLKDHFECLVFHATGPGGRSMEHLLESGLLSAVIDVTTSDIVDLLFGGNFAAAEDRLGAVARTRAPYVGSCGAIDMINFRSPEAVPEHYRSRTLHRHNQHITLVRTLPDEGSAVGRWIAAKLNRCEGPVRFLLPEKGVSALDSPQCPFYDPEADRAFFDAIETNVHQNGNRQVRRVPFHINDPGFATVVVESFLEITK